jgi:hypothetical protein
MKNLFFKSIITANVSRRTNLAFAKKQSVTEFLSWFYDKRELFLQVKLTIPLLFNNNTVRKQAITSSKLIVQHIVTLRI